MQTKLFIAWTTLETRAQAEALACLLVESRLVACAQIDAPITSTYIWEGRMTQSQEHRLTLKFSAERLEAVRACVLKNHPYRVAQWVAVRAEDVSEAYGAWVVEQTSDTLTGYT